MEATSPAGNYRKGKDVDPGVPPAFRIAVIAATAAQPQGRSWPAVLGGGGSAGPVVELRGDLGAAQQGADPAVVLLVVAGQGVEHVVVVFSA
jgi:hypothetical protein